MLDFYMPILWKIIKFTAGGESVSTGIIGKYLSLESQMKIFVTGATGFIGRHLVPALLEQGHIVRCLARARSQQPESFRDRVAWVVGDILDLDSLKNACRDIDLIIHLAGTIKSTKPETYYHVNVGGTKNLLEAIRFNGESFPKFIYLSSQAAIGPSPDLTPLVENCLPQPISDYGRSKRAGEELIINCKNLDYTIIRPSIVYGPEDRESLKLFTIAGLHLNPRIGFTRNFVSFIHVFDLVELISLCISNPRAHCQIFHASDGNDKGYSTRDVIRLSAQLQDTWVIPVYIPKYLLKIAAKINNRIAPLFGAVPIFNPDKYKELTARGWILSTRKARDHLGFKPKYNLTTGFKETIDWYRENQWL